MKPLFPEPAQTDAPHDLWPECEEFYNLMQTYRHSGMADQEGVVAAYEAVKAWLREHR